MAERTLRGARLGVELEDERGIEFAARQQVGYRCPQAHEFEITMSVEADIPAVWECPRCGAEALSVSGIVPEAKNEKPARTHWDMLLERRSEKPPRGHPQGASGPAARRRDRPGAPAPRQRQEAQGDRVVLAVTRPPLRPGPRIHQIQVRGDVRSGTSAAGRPRGSAGAGRPGRVNGRISRIPSASVTNPGLSISVPPTRIRAPSAVLPGRHPTRLQRGAQRLPRPATSRLINQPPSRLSSTSSRIVHQGPITCPTWIST